MGVNARTELDGPTHSAQVVIKQILEISCDFQTKGAPPKVMTCLCCDLTAFALPLGSCPNAPAKSASAQTLKSNVLSCLIVTPLLTVPAGLPMMHLTALVCDSFGCVVH